MDQETWILEACRDFSHATGWTLRYSPRIEGLKTHKGLTPRHDEEAACWGRPLSDGVQNCGMLTLDIPEDSAHDRAFAMVCELAEMVGAMIDRTLTARAAIKDQERAVDMLVGFGQSRSSGRHPSETLQTLLQATTQLTDFRAAAFFLLQPEMGQLTLRAEHQLEREAIPLPRRELNDASPDQRAMNGARVVVHPQADTALPWWLPAGMSSGFCTAVHSDVGPIGTLWVFDRRHRTPTDREIHVIETIAAQIGAALERVVLLRENESQRRLRHDLREASDSQGSNFVISKDVPLPFEVAGRCASRYELGGDLCEVLPIDSRYTVIAIGDASGDSVPAAIVMSTFRGAMRTIIHGGATDILRTDRVMQRLNEVLYSLTPSHQFMSILFGVFDAADNSLTYTNAGHPTPILFHRGQPSMFQSHGMLLGVIADAAYERSVTQLSAGDVVIGFTDGVTEAMNRRRKMFRQDGIVSVVRACVDQPAEQILEAIWEKVDTHAEGNDDKDDRSLLVLRIREPARFDFLPALDPLAFKWRT